jgi:hypothetical protein
MTKTTNTTPKSRKPSAAPAKPASAPKSRKVAHAAPAAPAKPASALTTSLAGIVAAPAPVAAPYNLTTCPKCGSDELFTGRCDASGIVRDELLVGGCHACDWTYDVRTTRSTKTPDLTLVIAKEFKPRTNNAGENPTGRWAQRDNWDALVKAIQAHGGKITYAEAVQAVADSAKGTYEATANARGFVQGRVRNGHLVAA